MLDFVVHDDANNISLADSLIYIDPGAPRADFTKFEPLSYFSVGAGLATYRSSWAKDAFWGSFQSGAPHMSPKQHYDEGHIECGYFGADLLIDAGVWHGCSRRQG